MKKSPAQSETPTRSGSGTDFTGGLPLPPVAEKPTNFSEFLKNHKAQLNANKNSSTELRAKIKVLSGPYNRAREDASAIEKRLLHEKLSDSERAKLESQLKPLRETIEKIGNQIKLHEKDWAKLNPSEPRPAPIKPGYGIGPDGKPRPGFEIGPYGRPVPIDYSNIPYNQRPLHAIPQHLQSVYQNMPGSPHFIDRPGEFVLHRNAVPLSFNPASAPLDKLDQITQARDIYGNEIQTAEMLTSGGVKLQQNQRAEKKPESKLQFRNIGGQVRVVGTTGPKSTSEVPLPESMGQTQPPRPSTPTKAKARAGMR